MPKETKVDRHNDKDDFQCIPKCNFSYSICEQKHKRPDCINEYYSFNTVFDFQVNEATEVRTFNLNSLDKKINNINSIENTSFVVILFDDEPDTIYYHSPQQEIVEFVCFVCGVISLWTGFSIFTIYTFGKKASIKIRKVLKLNTTDKTI